MTATRTPEPRPLLPTIRGLYRLCRAVKTCIDDDYRAFEGDEEPGIQLTIGCNTDTGEWDYQTSDNSYSGAAYFYPDWAVVGVYRDSNCHDLARDIRNQLSELFYSR